MSEAEIFVTGASGALGSGVVKGLRARGLPTVAIDRAGGEARLMELFGADPGCRGLAFDITSPAAWQAALGAAAPLGAVLTAGAWRGGSRFFEADGDAIWRAMLLANLETARVSLQALLPSMVRARGGSIVVVGSRAAVRPMESVNAAAYAASKAALVALVQSVAAEVLDDGVRINAVLPSTIDTRANRVAMPAADPSRWVTIESLTGVVAFLLSDAAKDISGAAIPVYGRVGV